jgi:hypothetical protein
MQAETGERWRELCQQAAVEQDAQKLIQLIREINELLEMKERRLQQQHAPPGTAHEAAAAITRRSQTGG